MRKQPPIEVNNPSLTPPGVTDKPISLGGNGTIQEAAAHHTDFPPHRSISEAWDALTPEQHAEAEAATNIPEAVVHPLHYGGDTTYEVFKVIDAWGVGFYLGNSLKYIARAGKKDPTKTIEDLKKAAFYIEHQIMLYEREIGH